MISHLHGDHFYGLIGLISTFGLLNRQTELHIFAPKGIKEAILLLLKTSKSWINFPLEFHELESKESEIIFEDEKVEVKTIPLSHRIYTNGFLFKEKVKDRSLNINAINKIEEIEICDYNNLKKGRDYTLKNGNVVKNEDLTFDPPIPLSYAYCSDTAYFESIIPIIKNSDILYHESTFLKDKEDLAKTTKHSTAEQAAIIAKKANVKELLLGHFSSRYTDEYLFYEEAKTVFSNSKICFEGMIVEAKN